MLGVLVEETDSWLIDGERIVRGRIFVDLDLIERDGFSTDDPDAGNVNIATD